MVETALPGSNRIEAPPEQSNRPIIVAFGLSKVAWQDEDGKVRPLSAKVRVTDRLVNLRVGIV